MLTKPTNCEETEGTKMFRMAVERYMPGMIQEIETGRLVLEQVNEAGMIVLKGASDYCSADGVAGFFLRWPSLSPVKRMQNTY